MSKRKNEHLSISEVLQDFVNDNKLKKGLDKVQVREVWNKEMGPAIAKYTTSVKFDQGVLYVDLSSSVLREELSYGKEKIKKMLNQSLDRELVSKIIFR